MDTLIKDGDFSLNSSGQPLTIFGTQEILQRVRLQLCIKKGSFLYNPDLGSDLFTLPTYNGDIETKALFLTKKALEDISGTAVEGVKVQKNQEEQLQLKISILINQKKHSLEVNIK
ncbi:MAG: hypothetical protein LBJ95_05080 [Oscillospiraceae bacterium]|nr:hypothetical protein [Oscillospiraceae bacterium]